MRMITRTMLPVLVVSCLLVLALVTTPCNAFAPLSPAHDSPPLTRLGMFDWVNDVFGDKSKKKEEEKAAATAAIAKAEAEQAAEEAAKVAEANAKKEEEAARAKQAEEDAAMLAKAKAEAEAKFAQFEAEQKAKADAEQVAALKQEETKAKAEAETAAKQAAEVEAAAKQAAEVEAAADAKAAAEKLADEEAEATVVIAKVIVETEAPKEATLEEESSEHSIDDFIQETIKNKSRIKGVVQWYNGGSGFGFIKPYRTEEEKKKIVQALRGDRSEKIIQKKTATYSKGIFVHHSAVQAPDDNFFRKLYPVELVECEIGLDGRGRPVAKNVTGPGGDFVKAILKQRSDRLEGGK